MYAAKIFIGYFKVLFHKNSVHSITVRILFGAFIMNPSRVDLPGLYTGGISSANVRISRRECRSPEFGNIRWDNRAPRRSYRCYPRWYKHDHLPLWRQCPHGQNDRPGARIRRLESASRRRSAFREPGLRCRRPIDHAPGTNPRPRHSRQIWGQTIRSFKLKKIMSKKTITDLNLRMIKLAVAQYSLIYQVPGGVTGKRDNCNNLG